MQLDWHDLRINGSPALMQALKQIETALTQQEQDITELQYLLSEELILRLAPRSPRLLTRQRQVIEELGHGWWIERCATPNASAATSTPPAATPATTTVEEVDRQMSNVERLIAAYQTAFIHSPGYPADDEA